MTSVFTRKSGRVSGQISVLAEGPKESFLYFRFYPETFFSHCSPGGDALRTTVSLVIHRSQQGCTVGKKGEYKKDLRFFSVGPSSKTEIWPLARPDFRVKTEVKKRAPFFYYIIFQHFF